ncbi:uncharacterized protein G2W53_033340 [Senna tora]|uniref:Uncharacterized protein n=1 Tax=Senna tora TaxID=362788 RepID=A0A834SYA4_9FABA|nr:uncharacterized protein G2W53_033340 [Senna tora]
MEKINISTLVFGKEVASHPLMVRKRKGRPREGDYEPTCKRARGKGKEVTTSRSKLWSFVGLEFNPDFPGRKAFLTQFSPDAHARRGAAEYHRLKTIVEQMQNKICQVESDGCDHERAHQAAKMREGELERNVVIAQLKVNLQKSEYDDLKTKVGVLGRELELWKERIMTAIYFGDEGKCAAGPNELVNDGVDLIPQDKEMGVAAPMWCFCSRLHLRIVVTSQNKVGEASQQSEGGEAGIVQQIVVAPQNKVGDKVGSEVVFVKQFALIVVASQNIVGEASEQAMDDEMELVKQVTQ